MVGNLPSEFLSTYLVADQLEACNDIIAIHLNKWTGVGHREPHSCYRSLLLPYAAPRLDDFIEGVPHGEQLGLRYFVIHIILVHCNL